MTYSSIVFFIKMGLALGGAIAGWLLAGFGYQADTVQDPGALNGILLSFSIFPALAFFAVALIMTRYKLTEDKVEAIHKELSTA